MKSYTDLEQSKKLAEILPLESADMNYSNMCPKGVMYSNSYSAGLSSYNIASRMNQENIDFYLQGEDYKGIIAWKILPCWSLAALLSAIREAIGYTIYGVNNVYMSCDLGDKPWKLETKVYNNEVDACFEMILKLHELRML